MLGNFLIGLREGLEAALIVSILLAYLVKTDRSHLVKRVWAGVALAAGVSLAFGALLTFGTAGLDEAAEEIIAGVLSISAVGLVTWMIFWMARASHTLSGRLRSEIDAAADNRWAVPVIAALAVGREGLETALFLWATTRAALAEGGTAAGLIVGALLGLAAAIALGWAIYAGAVRIDLRHFFTVSGAFLILVAAGVLVYGVRELQQAGVLPLLTGTAYDITAVMPAESPLGILLRTVFNLRPTATLLQAMAWLAYVSVVGTLFVLRSRPALVRQTAPLAS